MRHMTYLSYQFRLLVCGTSMLCICAYSERRNTCSGASVLYVRLTHSSKPQRARTAIVLILYSSEQSGEPHKPQRAASQQPMSRHRSSVRTY
uniref:Secreted protein n=1 Tax=Rhipicephalus appendiculatus TaxID=34631 RepID=A0A131YBI2_RHIAP